MRPRSFFPVALWSQSNILWFKMIVTHNQKMKLKPREHDIRVDVQHSLLNDQKYRSCKLLYRYSTLDLKAERA